MNNKFVSPCLIALLASQAYAEPAVQPAPTATPASSLSAAPMPTAPAPTLVDCNYHIPANQSVIDPAIITTWAEKAAVQSFNFTPASIQNQMDTLKPCYTEQGWRGFSDALQKSGNVESIKSQQLNVSSQLDGTSNINTVKDGQWKVTLPLLVVYQNDKEKVTQRLSISLLIGRKPSGDLGIMQLVAIARPTEVGASDKSATDDETSTSGINQPQAATPANDTAALPARQENSLENPAAPLPSNKTTGN